MNARRTLRPLLVSALLPFLASAAPVTPEGAAELVKGYAAYTGGELLDGRVAAPAGDPRPVTTEIDGEEVLLAWAFEMEPAGWILVAGDDRMAPVVGFSAEGSLGDSLWNPVAPPYHFVRENLADMYCAVTGAGMPAPAPAAPGADDGNGEGNGVPALEPAAVAFTADAASRWAKYRAASKPRPDDGLNYDSPRSSVADIRVDALLGDIKWSQSGNGEDYYTPSNFVCGCVQTALGQIMYYHKWPQTGIGRISRQVRVTANGTTTTPTLTTRGGDGNGGPYKWSTMTPSSTTSDAQREARGALLYDLGVVNGASYASGGTSANQFSTVIINNLKYASSVDWYGGDDTITNMFCSNFDAGYPVDVGGSGHQVVFDGYGFEDGQLYYHVNLGWGGSSNGWFLKNGWGNGTERYTYYLQDTNYNIFPDKTGEIVSGRVLYPDGTPFSGVTVTIKKADGSTLATATSNAKGIWAYAGVPSSSTITVTAAASGRSFETLSVEMGKSQSSGSQVGNRWGVNLIAYPATQGTVRGLVTGADGQPVKGVRIATGDGLYSATTGADGRYSFLVSAGWSGVVSPAGGQGALTSEPASRSVGPLAGGAFVDDCDFVVAFRYYVDADATGAGDGSSWEDAYPSLAAALAAAPDGAEIWVAEGVYKPTTGSDRKARFALPARAKVYGGFAGGETMLSERDWIENRTVLSGEIGSASSRTDNSPMLVLGAKGASLDGFVLTAAYSKTSEYASTFGATDAEYGVIAMPGSGTSITEYRTFRVEHCLIEDNDYGNALVTGWLLLANCVARNNRAGGTGVRLSRGGWWMFSTIFDNTGGVFHMNVTSAAYPLAHYYACYLHNPGFTGSTHYSYVQNTDQTAWNVHLADDPPGGTTNNTSVLVVSGETLSTDDRTPGKPPAGSKAIDRVATTGCGLFIVLNDPEATDFAGRPRTLGPYPDAGAYEMPEHGSEATAITVEATAVGDTTATLTWNLLDNGSSSTVYIGLVAGPDPALSQSNVVSLSIGYKSPGSTGTYELTGLKPGTDYYARGTLYMGATGYRPISRFRTGVGSAPVVSGIEPVDVAEESASVAVTLSSLGIGSSRADVLVEISRTKSFSEVVDAKTVSFSAAGTKTAAFSGLTDDMTYFVRVVATGSNGVPAPAWTTDFTTVNIPQQAPKFGAVEASDVTSSGASVSVTLAKVGKGSRTASATVEVSASPSFASIAATAAAQTWTGPGTKTFSVSSLSPGVVYYVRVTATGSNGLVATDTTASFETYDPQRPTGSVVSGATTLYTIPVSWTLVALGSGNSSATLSVEYGTTDAYGQSVAIGSRSAAASGTATIAGLSPETEYWVRLRAVGSPTGKIGVSEPVRVATQPVGNPTVAVSPGSPSQSSIPVSWSLSALGEGAANASVWIDWGATPEFEGAAVSVATGATAARNGTATISGLEPGTKYYLRVRAVNDAGKVGVSATRAVTTVQPDEPTFEVSAAPYRTGATIFADVALLGHQAASVGGTVVVSTSASLSPAVATATLTEASSAPSQIAALASGLSANTTYYYSVTVRNDRNKSATKTGTFTTLSSAAPAYGTGHWEGGLLQGYNQGNGQQWGLDISLSATERAVWNASGFSPSFARGAIASYQTKGTWTNPYDGATYPIDDYNRMWAYGGQMWMEKDVTYYFAANFFISTAISIDGRVVVSEYEGGRNPPKVGSFLCTSSGWHDIAVAVATCGNGGGAAANPWNGGSPFVSLKYGTAWNTNGLSSVTSDNAAQWSRLMDEGDRHLLRARGARPETIFLDRAPTWTATSMSVPVTIDATAGGRTLEVYASTSSNAWYFADRWERTVTVGTVAAGASVKTATFANLDTTTNWYVSARLHDASGYDEWTDAVLFEPFVSDDRPPAIGAVAAEATGRTTATVEVSIDDIGAGSDSAAVSVFVSSTGSFGSAPAATATLVAPGTETFELTGLSPGTAYAVRVVAAGSNGLAATDESASFTTLADAAPTLGTPTATAAQTTAAVSVPVLDLGSGSSSVTVKVVVNGVERTQTLPGAGTAILSFSGLSAATAYTAAITATGSNGRSATATVSFTTEAAAPTGWFDVRWSSQGWGSGAAWRTSAGESAAGGVWSVPSGDASSRSGSLLALGLPEGGVLRFAASQPSASKATVTVQGSFAPVLASAPPDAPAGAIAGLCFARGGYKAWNGSAWIALTGAAPAASATAWTATFDCSGAKPRVRYTVGGAALKASGAEWIPLATSQCYVTGVGYAGAGSVGDFRATYTGGGFVAPVLATLEGDGHAPLGFGKDSSNNPTFEVTVKNAAKDAWYTVYASDTVDGTYKAVKSEPAPANGLMTLSIPAPSSKPTRFVRIGVSDDQVPENTEL